MITKEPFFKPQDESSYFCTEDIGLAAYLLYKNQELAGIQRGRIGELMILIKTTSDTETLTDNYRILPDIDYISEYLNAISNINKNNARK